MAYDKRKSNSEAGQITKRIKTDHNGASEQKSQHFQKSPQNGVKTEDGKQSILNGKSVLFHSRI